MIADARLSGFMAILNLPLDISLTLPAILPSPRVHVDPDPQRTVDPTITERVKNVRTKFTPNVARLFYSEKN